MSINSFPLKTSLSDRNLTWPLGLKRWQSITACMSLSDRNLTWPRGRKPYQEEKYVDMSQ